MEPKKLRKKLATIIQKADKSYFFEDYGAQADAVLAWLREEQLMIVPKEPTEQMVEAGTDAIQRGTVVHAVSVRGSLGRRQ